jgi:hypothetical protein
MVSVNEACARGLKTAHPVNTANNPTATLGPRTIDRIFITGSNSDIVEYPTATTTYPHQRVRQTQNGQLEPLKM